MNRQLLHQIIHTKTMKVLFLCGIVYFLGFLIFRIWIEPDLSKTAGDPANWIRDFLWLFYWRWYIDWPIILGFIGIGTLMCNIFSHLAKKIPKSIITTYIFPISLMILNYIGMLAIDVAITWFADTGFNGTWISPEKLLFNLTAQRLYHGFFFWYMPALIIVGISVNTFLHTERYAAFFKTLCIFLAGFALCLGFLDPVVCQLLWNDWRIFGEWAMMGYDPMWAEGWIAHYIIFAVCWLFAVYLIERIVKELQCSSDKSKGTSPR